MISVSGSEQPGPAEQRKRSGTEEETRPGPDGQKPGDKEREG